MSRTEGEATGALRWLWLAAAVVAADQASKQLVLEQLQLFEVRVLLPVLELTHLQNTGAAFSMLAGASGWQRWFFIALALGVSTGIVFWLRALPRHGPLWLPAALALVMGGALGNVVDRLRHGYVIDFIHLHWERWYFPAFNVADTAITIGAGLLILDALIEGRRHRRGGTAA